jgi:hypothetical protein
VIVVLGETWLPAIPIYRCIGVVAYLKSGPDFTVFTDLMSTTEITEKYQEGS